MKLAFAAFFVVVAVIGAFFVGRASVAIDEDDDVEEARADAWFVAHPPDARQPSATPRKAKSSTTATLPKPAALPESTDATKCVALQSWADGCAAAVAARDVRLAEVEQARVEREGSPIVDAMTQSALPARFASAALVTAVQQAFVSARVPGAVEGVDCSEFPCILFGRIHGGEDEIEKAEKAASLSPYADDILTILLWTTTDETAKQTLRAQGKEAPNLEQSLYAAAFYSVADKERYGDNLDRRLRTRTAELWNTAAPQDESGQ